MPRPTLCAVVLRRDADVRAAFHACPDLDALLDVFVKLIQQPAATQQQQQGAGGNGSGSSGSTAAQSHKRKVHPFDVQLVGQQPKHKRGHVELSRAQIAAETAARAAAARAEAERRRHKRVAQQVYDDEAEPSPSGSDGEEDENEPQMSDSEAAYSDEEKIFPGDALAASPNTLRQGQGQRAGQPAASRSQPQPQSASQSAPVSAAERAALSHLSSQQHRYSQLQSQYAAIQNEIFSKTVHDLRGSEVITGAQLSVLVHLWTQTEAGSNAIRALIQRYERDADELQFMFRLVQLAKRFESGEAVAPSDSEAEPIDEQARSAAAAIQLRCRWK